MCTDVTFMQERLCDCGYRKRDKQSGHVLTVFSMSVHLQTKVLFNLSKVIAL